MKILLALDSFKNSFNSIEINTILKRQFSEKRNDILIDLCPVSDGGEGSIDVIKFHRGGKLIQQDVHDPLFKEISATYLFNDEGNTAFIEMAKASGLELLKDSEINCMHTSSIGTGNLIQAALDRGAKQIFLFVGGSATHDLGIGMASALGYKFYANNELISRPTGKDLMIIDQYSDYYVSEKIKNCQFTVLCDVENPLLGREGAAHIYAAQKGANQYAIEYLEEGAHKFSESVGDKNNIHLKDIPGAGAAGGLGYGALLFLSAKIQKGAAYILNEIGFTQKLRNCDLVITGEGKIDHQTLYGKLISQIANMSFEQHKRLLVIAALSNLQKSEYLKHHIEKIYTLYDHSPSKISIQDSLLRLQKITNQIIHDYL